MKEKALKYFRGKEGYNCAQSIMRAFCRHCSPAQIDSLRGLGSGRAPGGLCGAVAAADMLLGDPEKSRRLKEIFMQRAGSLRCRDILRNRDFSCKDCVETAGDFLERNLVHDANDSRQPLS